MLGVLNPPNRRIRFRMYGGVGGAESQDSPLSRLTDLPAGAFQQPFQTMAARGVGVRFQRAPAIQIANPMRLREERQDLGAEAAGEPAASVIPSAISNAVFDATGVRLRSIPYTPAKVKAAMQAS